MLNYILIMTAIALLSIIVLCILDLVICMLIHKDTYFNSFLLPLALPQPIFRRRKKETGMLTKDWYNDCATVEKLREEYINRVKLTSDGVYLNLGGLSFLMDSAVVMRLLDLHKMAMILVLRSAKALIGDYKSACPCCGHSMKVTAAPDCIAVVCTNSVCDHYDVEDVVVGISEDRLLPIDEIDAAISTAVDVLMRFNKNENQT